jgi:hypothetical protein
VSTQFSTLARAGTKPAGSPSGIVRLGALLAAVTAVGAVVAVTFAPVAAPVLPAVDASITYVDGRPELSSTSAPSDFWAHTWDQTGAPAAPYGHNGDQTEAQSAAQEAVAPPAQGHETYDVIVRTKRDADLAAVSAIDAFVVGAAAGEPVLAGAVPFDETRELSAVPSLPAGAEAPRFVVRETHQGYEGTLEQSPSVVAWPAPVNYDT